jgi:hypothetical protein
VVAFAEPNLVSDSLGDAGVYIDLHFARRALLLDLGSLEALSSRRLLCVGHAFGRKRALGNCDPSMPGDVCSSSPDRCAALNSHLAGRKKSRLTGHAPTAAIANPRSGAAAPCTIGSAR